MGYFSTLDMESGRIDYSYPSPERQLLWRLDELKERLCELRKRGAHIFGERVLSDDDLRYALPENLSCAEHVRKAIVIARSDLYAKYDVMTPEEEEEALNVLFADCECGGSFIPGQISLFERSGEKTVGTLERSA